MRHPCVCTAKQHSNNVLKVLKQMNHFSTLIQNGNPALHMHDPILLPKKNVPETNQTSVFQTNSVMDLVSIYPDYTVHHKACKKKHPNQQKTTHAEKKNTHTIPKPTTTNSKKKNSQRSRLSAPAHAFALPFQAPGAAALLPEMASAGVTQSDGGGQGLKNEKICRCGGGLEGGV